VIAYPLSMTGWLGWVVALGLTPASSSAFSKKKLKEGGFPVEMMIQNRNRM
jgi:hypothetical protein